MTLTMKEFHEILSWVAEMGVRHHTEVQKLRERIQSLEVENGWLQDALGNIEAEAQVERKEAT